MVSNDKQNANQQQKEGWKTFIEQLDCLYKKFRLCKEKLDRIDVQVL